MSSEDVSDVEVLSQCWEGKERYPIDRSVCLPTIKPAFRTGLRDLLRRLDARMESPPKQPACLSYEFALVQGVNVQPLLLLVNSQLLCLQGGS